MSQWIVHHPSQHGQGQLTVPIRLARVIPRGARFEPELTDDGLLYRFVGIVERTANTTRAPIAVDVPKWAEE